jgi:hypothetical protein
VAEALILPTQFTSLWMPPGDRAGANGSQPAGWELIEPFLPIGRYGPFLQRLREQFEGVIWRFRTGSQWREMPEEFGAWQAVYDRFAQWRDVGVFECTTTA